MERENEAGQARLQGRILRSLWRRWGDRMARFGLLDGCVVQDGPGQELVRSLQRVREVGSLSGAGGCKAGCTPESGQACGEVVRQRRQGNRVRTGGQWPVRDERDRHFMPIQSRSLPLGPQNRVSGYQFGPPGASQRGRTTKLEVRSGRHRTSREAFGTTERSRGRTWRRGAR